MRMSVLSTALLATVLAGPVRAEGPKAAGGEPLIPAKLKRVRLLGDPSFRHGGTITCIVPLGDGRTALTSARDGSVRLWDLATGSELRRFYHPKGEDVWNVRLLPGRREFLSAGEDKCVTRWHLDTGEALSTYSHGVTVFRVDVHPDRGRFVSGDSSNGCILWDLQRAKEVRRYNTSKKSVYTVQFSKDGDELYGGLNDGTVRVWSVETGKEKRRISRGLEDVYSLVPSADRSRMLACCSKKSLWLMDAASGDELWQAGLKEPVKHAAWSPDERTVGAVCDDGHLYVLDAKDGKQKWRVQLPGSTHWSVAFSLDGKQILCGADHLLCRFDAGTGARIFPKGGAEVQCLGVKVLLPVPGSRLLLQGGQSKGIRVQNADTGRIEHTWLPERRINCMAVSSDGKLLLASVDNSGVSMLDVRTGKVLWRSDQRYSSAAIFAGGGRWAVAAGGDGVAVLQAKDGAVVRRISLPDDKWASDLAIGGDGSLVAVVYDGTVGIWDVAGGAQMCALKDAQKSFTKCAFVPSGKEALLAVSADSISHWQAPARGQLSLSEAQIKLLIRQLGADTYAQRDSATRKLIAQGRAILPALKAGKSTDAELLARLDLIRAKIRETAATYRKTDALKREDAQSDSLSFHPDGWHWAAILGKYGSAEVVIGQIEDGKLKIVRRLKDPNMPAVVSFADDGTLYVGNLNGTVSAYATK